MRVGKKSAAGTGSGIVGNQRRRAARSGHRIDSMSANHDIGVLIDRAESHGPVLGDRVADAGGKCGEYADASRRGLPHAHNGRDIGAVQVRRPDGVHGWKYAVRGDKHYESIVYGRPRSGWKKERSGLIRPRGCSVGYGCEV